MKSNVAQDRRLLTVRQPVGVAAAITPWNFPLAMITRKVAPAIAAGCPVVVKPSEYTPLTALALARLADGLIPPGVLNVIPASRANAQPVGEVLCDSDVVSSELHGSTAVGKWLYSRCASTVKKLGLELGGNAPMIVLKSADLDTAVRAAMASKYRYGGQTCVCADRFLVHEAVVDAFVEKLAAEASSAEARPRPRRGDGYRAPDRRGGDVQVSRESEGCRCNGWRLCSAAAASSPDRARFSSRRGPGRRHGQRALAARDLRAGRRHCVILRRRRGRAARERFSTNAPRPTSAASWATPWAVAERLDFGIVSAAASE